MATKLDHMGLLTLPTSTSYSFTSSFSSSPSSFSSFSSSPPCSSFSSSPYLTRFLLFCSLTSRTFLFILKLTSPFNLQPTPLFLSPLHASFLLFLLLLPLHTVCSSSSAAAHPRRSQTTAAAAAGVEGPEGKQDAGVPAQNRKSSPSETGSPLLGNANNPNMADIPERRRTSATPSVSQGPAFFPAVASSD